MHKFTRYRFILFAVIIFIFPLRVWGIGYVPDRCAFPAVCKNHFDNDKATVNTWKESAGKDFIDPLKKYLKFIPRNYIPDCFGCAGCGGVGYEDRNKFDAPTHILNYSGFDNTHQIIVNQEFGFDDHKGQLCKGYCWDGGYFRKWNHKFSHFFEHFLIYCSENPDCDCYWPEENEEAISVNDLVYDFLKDYCDAGLIDSSFSEYWIAKKVLFNSSGKYFGENYYPNSHGMASSLTTYTFFYSQYHQMLFSVASFIDANSIVGNSKAINGIYSLLETLRWNFEYLYDTCLSNHPHPKIYYERGMLKMHIGDIQGAFWDIRELMNMAESDDYRDNMILTSEMYQQEGQVYAEMGMYDQSITSLTEAIKKDPKNKEAYFNRAQAYFETGDFEQALKDYLISEKSKSISKILRTSIEYKLSLLKGLAVGGAEGTADLALTLLHSPYGASEPLWSFVQDPGETTINFCNSVYDAVECAAEYFKKFDWETLEGYAEDLKDFYQRFDRLSDDERGYFTGYYIGKYGIDFVIGGAVGKGIKGVAAFKKAKDANKICTLETMAASQANKETVVASALKQSARREAFFKNVKIEWDKQNKHIPGKHNYNEQKNRSIFEHNNAQELLNKFAGKGRRTPGYKIGPGYKEVIDFKERIGYYVDENGLKLPTTKGTIHYSKKGAHIVPTHPESLIIN